MQNRYKVVITNNLLYKEIELGRDAQRITVGTGIGCDVRLHKSLFFEPVELRFQREGDLWTMVCSDNLYLSSGDIRKLITKKMEHGDLLEVKYQQSNQALFKVEFLIDFDDGSHSYERMIDLAGRSCVTIGADRSRDIVLGSQHTAMEDVELNKEEDGYRLHIRQSRYSVYHNGKKAEEGELIHNGDFFSISDFSFYLKDSCLWTHIRNDIWVNSLRSEDFASKENYPMFKRNTRVRVRLNEDAITVLDPPAMPQEPKESLFMKLLPSIGMLLAAGVMAAMGGGRMIIMSLISGGIAIYTAVVNYRQDGKAYKEAVRNRIHQYNAYIMKKRDEIWRVREEERLLREKQFTDQFAEKSRILSFSPDLFDRRADDDDFLCVRVGTGSVVSARNINYKPQEKLVEGDELQMIPEQLYREFTNLPNAPVVIDLKQVNAVGIYGPAEYRYSMMKNFVMDLAARQYHTDLKMIFAAEECNKDKIYWLRMLPHVYNETIKVRNIACNSESRNLIFEYLYKELSERQHRKGYDSRIVVFLYDNCGFYTHPLSRFVDVAAALGVTLVFFGEGQKDIPLGCSYLLEMNSPDSGRLIDTRDEQNATHFSYPTILDTEMKRVVEMLAPVYTEEISLESSLTKSYSMFEMLDIISVDDLDLEKRWQTSQVYRSMAAPVGVTKTEMLYLDLHDKAHGPHGLVAGTTGSGKSELLQTYILSMATLYHPYEVAFVIIDFKGGGMVNQFADLPHLLGAITNIDGKEIDRSLKSIKAELQKRQRYFAAADVNHIDKYIRKYRAGEVSEPLPHLIVIVDEFAELKAEQPEFMKELISAARIGRSLGVHLILATQKPSGQVNEQIWSNSRFKLCLKVQDKQDSNEVLKSPLAAEIKEPGRAYLQVGNNEIFELFQSAYSGAPEKIEDSVVKNFTIYGLSEQGRRTPVYVQKRKKSDGNAVTQLDALVSYIHAAGEKMGIEKLPNICLPSLQNVINLPANTASNQNKYSIGIYDDPDNQYQGDAWFDFDANNTLVVGASQTGKTNLLQLIIRQICADKKANEANFYIMDFGSMILKNFEDLNHVGGVVIPSEEEKLKNLFKMLMQEIELRKEKLMKVGVSSISSYMEAGYRDLPRIYLILDNFAVFKELYADKFEDDFLFLAREGIAYGISMIVTASTTNGISYRYMSNFANHVAFTCNDSSEYSNLFDRCRMTPNNVPGRMLVSFNKTIYEAQSYLSFEGEKEIDRIGEIKKFLAEQNRRNSGIQAKKIPEVPDQFDLDYIYRNFPVDPKNQIAVALNYQLVEPVYFDLRSMCQLALVGKQTANMVAFEKALLQDFKYNYFDRPVDVYIIDSLTRDLAKYADEPFVKKHTLDYSKMSTILEDITDELEERLEEVMDEGLQALDNKPLLVVMINNMAAIEYISSTKQLMTMFNNIVSKYKAMKVLFLFGGIADEAIGYSSGDLLKKIKESKHAFIFTNPAEHKIFDIPVAFARQNKKAIDDTQGYYIKEANVAKIRFAKEE